MFPLLGMAVAADNESPTDFEIRLIWGSNDSTSPDPTHKKLDSALTSWLKKKLRWGYYYEVNRKVESIQVGKTAVVKLSNKCTVKVKNNGNSRLYVELLGDNKMVNKVTDTLKEWLILAGDDKNDTAWFVVIRKVKKAK